MSREKETCAVLHDGTLWRAEQLGEKRRLRCEKVSRPIQYADELLLYAREKGLHRLWVCPDSEVSTVAREQTERFIEAPTGMNWRLHEEDNTDIYEGMGYLPTSITVFYQEKIRFQPSWGQIILPEYDGRWETLCYQEDPALLCITLYYLEQAMQISMHSSPARTGQAWMKAMGKKWPSRYKVTDLSMLPEVGCAPLYWKRPLTESERKRTYIHVYDKRAQHVDACTDAHLGVGVPRHVWKPAYTRYQAGVYRIRIKGATLWNGGWMPPILADASEEQWVWGPLVAAACDAGYDVDVLEGFVWDESHRLLQRWAKSVLLARKTLETEVKQYPCEPARLAALQELKRIGVAAIGLLAAQADETWIVDGWYRPDWYRLIVATARTRLLYGMMTRWKLGYDPVMVVADSVAYLSDDPDPQTAVPDILKRGFHLKYRLPLKTNAEVFDPECTVAEANRRLNDAAKQEVEEHGPQKI